MPTDEQILQICRVNARMFIKKTAIPFDELVNVAFVMAKTHPNSISLKSSIIWALIRHTKIVRRDYRSNRKIQAKLDLIDYREKESEPKNSESLLEAQEQSNLLIKAVIKLSQGERNLIYWHYRDGMTFTQIGKELSCSRRWASMMIQEILKKLRKELSSLDPRR